MDFISKLLVRDPHQRLGGGGAEQVKSHAFFTGIDWQLLLDRRYQPPFNPCTDQDITSAENFESEFRDLEISASEDIGAHEPNAEGMVREHRLGSDTFAGFSFQPDVRHPPSPLPYVALTLPFFYIVCILRRV